MNHITHKRGTTFSYTGLVKLPGSAWAAVCKLYRDETLIETLTVTVSPLETLGQNGETHALLIEASAAATADWPLAKLSGDIAFSSDDVIVSTGTFHVLVQSGYSNG